MIFLRTAASVLVVSLASVTLGLISFFYFPQHSATPAERARSAAPTPTPVKGNPVKATAATPTVTVQITSKSNFYVGLTPALIKGLATSTTSLYATISILEPINNVTVIASSTIPVVDGVWSLPIPASLAEEPGSFFVCIAALNNEPSTCQTISILPAVEAVSMKTTSLSGSTDLKSGVSAISVDIYPILSGDPYRLGPLAARTSDAAVGDNWIIGLDPALKPNTVYEVEIYSPADPTIPIQQSALSVY
jgi:hypothetical protein